MKYIIDLKLYNTKVKLSYNYLILVDSGVNPFTNFKEITLHKYDLDYFKNWINNRFASGILSKNIYELLIKLTDKFEIETSNYTYGLFTKVVIQVFNVGDYVCL